MKKLLALVLALVMSMSLVTISNAAFNDADEIDYKEAVDVLSGVGVLAGYENGDFGAKDTLTRAQACKIIAYLDLGQKTADAMVGTGAVFSDVAASNWAAGYIEYCATAGYVAGIGDGKFAPNELVTGLQFAKMLLCVLGYDAAIESLNGSDWSINVAKLAGTNDLFDGISTAASVALTREKAAQVAFNALKADMVKYTTKGTTVKGDGFEVVTGASEAVKVENTEAKDYRKTTGDRDKIMQLCEERFDKLKLQTAGEDDFGRPAKKWVLDKDDIATSVTAADYVWVADKDYSAKDALATLKDKLDNSKLKDLDAAKIYVNAEDTDVDGLEAAMLPGLTVEVFADDDNKITDVIAYYYELDQITDVDTDVSKVDAADGVVAYLDFDGGLSGVKSTDIVGFNAKTYVEDAYVAVVVKDNEKIIASFIPTAVKGDVETVKANNFVTVDGTKYNMLGAAFSDLNGINAGDEHTLYLDNNGYVIGTVKGEETVSISDVYYVAKTWVKSENSYGTSSNKYYAQLVALDGTAKEVELETYAVSNDTVMTAGTMEGKLVTISDKKVTEGGETICKANNDKFNMALWSNDDYDVFSGTGDDTLKKTTARYELDGTTYRFGDNTKFVMVEASGSDLKVTAATGGVAVKDIASAIIITKDGKTLAQYVILISGDFADNVEFDSKTLLFVMSASSEKGDGYLNQKVYYADGTSKTLKVDDSQYPLDRGFYTAGTNSDGYVELEETTADDITDETFVWDDEKGVIVDGTYGELYENLLTVGDVEDIDVSKAAFVDAHDTDDDDQYDKTVSSLKALQNLFDKDNYDTTAEVSVIVTSDGATFVIVTELTHTKN